MQEQNSIETEKAKILFEAAKTEYQREGERSRAVNDKAAKMMSFVGLLFTIFSFLVWRLLLDNQQTWQWWAEWLAYGVSALLLVMLSWALASVLSALGGEGLNHADIGRHFGSGADSPEALYRTGSAAYWQAVEESRAAIAQQYAVLHRAAYLVRLSYLLLAVLVILLFLLV